MKKQIAAALFLAALFLGPAAEAKISASRMALGGITPGSTEDYLLKTYGPPKSVEKSYSPTRKDAVREYNYGDSFFVTVQEGTRSVIWLMSQERHNDIATPDGIKVGSTLDDVLRAYGEPDLRQIDGDVDYLWYMADGTENRLVFRVSFSRVVGITCGSK